MPELAGAELIGKHPLTVSYRGQPIGMRVYDGFRLHAIRVDADNEIHALCGTASEKLITWGTDWLDEHEAHLVRCEACLIQFPL